MDIHPLAMTARTQRQTAAQYVSVYVNPDMEWCDRYFALIHEISHAFAMERLVIGMGT